MAYLRPRSLAACCVLLSVLAGCAAPPVNQTPQNSVPAIAPAAEAAAPDGSRFSAFGNIPAPAPQAENPPQVALADPATPQPVRPIRPARATTPAAAMLAFPSLPAQDLTDTLPVPRVLDLTTQPDDLWVRIRNGFAMPNLASPLVVDRQIWYTAQPTGIRRMVDRSKRYLYHIVTELEKRGMPTELALLPMVESAFNPMAYSRAHASGLWQFIPSTGKSYNLQQNWWYDARRDIIASTTAALDYLQFLYDMHGDWHLALASYNWGENAVARAIERNKARGLPTDYLNLTMPQETRYYVPKLQALKNIIATPDKFNIALDAIPNEPYFVTVSIKDMDIRIAAKLAQMPVEELIALNPAHNRPIMSHGDTLVLPADRAEIFQTNLENHDQPLVTWQPYTFKKGDRLDKLAASTGISLDKLKQANGITARTRVGPGYQMLLPVKGLSAALEPLPAMFSPPQLPQRTTATRTVMRRQTHTVARGETLTAIADRYDVSVDSLRRWNSIGRLQAGQKLVIERMVNIPGSAPRAASGTRKPSTKPASTNRKPAPKKNVRG